MVQFIMFRGREYKLKILMNLIKEITKDKVVLDLRCA